MLVSVPKETYPEERRVALVPAALAPLTKAGVHVVVESGAGVQAGYPDEQYAEKGAKITGDREELFSADVVLQVRSLGANPSAGRGDLAHLGPDQTVIGMCDPLGAAESVRDLAATRATVFALELIPRITKAQSMDVLSSMATISGYKAVLLAANHLPKIFPLMMTAAGTLSAAKVFIIGAGVAGLQAIASSRRLGAVVQAYDVRPAVKEQIESLGAKFVEMPLEASDAEGSGGYAKAMGEEFYQKQRALMASVVAECDVCITTAAIPGKQSPLLVTADAVRGMKPGSVIVDLAAERGGNCELTKADETVVDSGVKILGPTNLPSEVPRDASQMFSKNITTFLLYMTKEGRLTIDAQDEIVASTLLTRGGQVVHPLVREILGIADTPAPEANRVASGTAAADDEDGIELEE